VEVAGRIAARGAAATPGPLRRTGINAVISLFNIKVSFPPVRAEERERQRERVPHGN